MNLDTTATAMRKRFEHILSGHCPLTVATTVRPVSETLRNSRTTSNALRASKPLVGSSRNRTDGDAASSTAMESLFFCSKLKPNPSSKPTSELPTVESSTSSRIWSTNASFSSSVFTTSGSSLRRAENITVSRTVNSGDWTSNCSTYPLLRRKEIGS